MSKKDKKKPSGAREPWEQSIYDTDKNAGGSRSEKRQQKKGNTVFLTILVILLLLIITLPVGTYLYVMRDKPNDNKEASKPSSSVVVQSSTKDSSTQASTQAPAASESAVDGQSSVPQETTPTSEAAEVYTEVLNGEGPNQVATRNGISTEELLQLNGLGADAMLQPGQSLRIK
ncbi:SAG1386/EF1546 family surface-associated protein [Enterococcus crotali]|uniref:SAG1386/EF1546 family surface-associated protein n=1 Tax=Enterococcus crotali TaxID=1453587 RepID=UPI000472F16E|nr:SAG1386/EF1546 family surface-associated protein [Enterococcus crotali]